MRIVKTIAVPVVAAAMIAVLAFANAGATTAATHTVMPYAKARLAHVHVVTVHGARLASGACSMALSARSIHGNILVGREVKQNLATCTMTFRVGQIVRHQARRALASCPGICPISSVAQINVAVSHAAESSTAATVTWDDVSGSIAGPYGGGASCVPYAGWNNTGCQDYNGPSTGGPKNPPGLPHDTAIGSYSAIAKCPGGAILSTVNTVEVTGHATTQGYWSTGRYDVTLYGCPTNHPVTVTYTLASNSP